MSAARSAIESSLDGVVVPPPLLDPPPVLLPPLELPFPPLLLVPLLVSLLALPFELLEPSSEPVDVDDSGIAVCADTLV